ncbi:MAG: SEC-C metal-binding domain-containing protein [Desulfitobacteriaceae bacterium]
MISFLFANVKNVFADDFSDYPDIIDFYETKDRFLFKILLLFLKYMYEEKNVSFPAASLIWFEAMDILINEDQVDETRDDFDEIFALNPELYSDEIFKRFGFLSTNTASAVAIAWGMSYVYDFLKKYDYISDSVHNSAMTEILSVQVEIIKARAKELWKYNYLHQWVKPDSVEEKDFIKEKEDFEYTFSNIIKTVIEPYPSLKTVAKKVPLTVVKIGRNDPCSCGSGKKYKKCCELSTDRLFD